MYNFYREPEIRYDDWWWRAINYLKAPSQDPNRYYYSVGVKIPCSLPNSHAIPHGEYKSTISIWETTWPTLHASIKHLIYYTHPGCTSKALQKFKYIHICSQKDTPFLQLLRPCLWFAHHTFDGTWISHSRIIANKQVSTSWNESPINSWWLKSV